jgi:hypothetical protein
VVLEDAFDELMQEIRRQQFVNIRMWKSMGKWLQVTVRMKMQPSEIL